MKQTMDNANQYNDTSSGKNKNVPGQASSTSSLMIYQNESLYVSCSGYTDIALQCLILKNRSITAQPCDKKGKNQQDPLTFNITSHMPPYI